MATKPTSKSRYHQAALRLAQATADTLTAESERGWENTYDAAARVLAAAHELFNIASWLKAQQGGNDA